MIEEYDWLFHEHSIQEEMLEDCNEAANLLLWDECKETFNIMITMMKTHMALEEEVIYPAYERHPDLPQDPVKALRLEHDHLVQRFSDLYQILKKRNSEHLVSAIKLAILDLNHHHDKEEDFFPPMAGHLLLP